MRRNFPIKRLPDGRAMLNLACGVKMHWGWNNLDFSPYAQMVKRPYVTAVMRMVGLLSETRLTRMKGVDPQIVCWDLRRGIPYADETFDVVYHSHFLEHVDRQSVPALLQECARVLKRDGIIRVVVPDLELLVNDYMASLQKLEKNEIGALKQHEKSIYWLFDQMVRRESTGTLEQKAWVQWLEKRLRGGASQTGELHRWMYDRYNLGGLLYEAGFRSVTALRADTGSIEGWSAFGLDSNADGTEYKPGSLYMEGVKG